ncbi:NarK/NasA family nitrate transporter [Geobacillus sp. C56-T2]|uniref:nitrate/nitrite transporter n=1 Tax=Geobacillus sp. C56-T2 TaxID=600773 RepID=UPI0011A1924E|nr:nitrate/nitrite transporter [Geobacillus sp. C56-T2]NNV05859.1 NarK/NasA family nitrate transporter [Geobacillus sp. MMMUD3]TWG30668.1 NNP family nitrate/nitrite transporter-like MFS transporter [Geobacillus sp. C56-T2]
MAKTSFWRAGHAPTLLSSFLYFDISFMIWNLLGALGVFVAESFALTPAEKGMMVAIPVLGGALLRVPMGLLADRWGGKRAGLLGMAVTAVPLVWGWLFSDHMADVYALGFLLGVGGASFAVALPLASRWYPKEYQGLAMGIAGAGNSGTVLATLFGPRLAEAYGWNAVFGLALAPLVVVFFLFAWLARECPTAVKPVSLREYGAVLRRKEAWLFCFFYSLSFGGFVGLTGYLGIFFFDEYGVSKVTAGDFVTAVVFAGSLIRPIGGYLADRIGGMRLLSLLFAVGAVLLAFIGALPPLFIVFGLMVVLFLCFGAANGALFQVVPTWFPKEVGLLTGIVGAAGGLGGFLLPNVLGAMKQWLGSPAYGFWLFAIVLGGAMLTARRLQAQAVEDVPHANGMVERSG